MVLMELVFKLNYIKIKCILDLNKTKMNTKLTNLLLVILLTLILSSCKNNADVERAIETFFVFIIQIVSFILFGISSLVLSIIGSTSKTNTPKIIGSIILGVFTLISIICFAMIIEINPKRDYIFFAFVVDAIFIGVSIFFLTKSKNKIGINAAITDDYLDKVIESKEEEEIDEMESI